MHCGYLHNTYPAHCTYVAYSIKYSYPTHYTKHIPNKVQGSWCSEQQNYLCPFQEEVNPLHHTRNREICKETVLLYLAELTVSRVSQTEGEYFDVRFFKTWGLPHLRNTKCTYLKYVKYLCTYLKYANKMYIFKIC